MAARRKRWHRGLDRDTVVAEALRLLDEEGREALTMRRLGLALGVEAPSLYAHIAGKDELVDAVLDRVLDGIELPPTSDDPRDSIVEGFGVYRRGLLAHPAVVRLMLERARYSGSQARLVTRSITLLEEAGLSTREAVDAHVALVAFVVGFVAQEVARPTVAPRPLLEAEDVMRRALAVLADRSVDERFDVGLRLILDGALGHQPA